jgi:hypothetical protein
MIRKQTYDRAMRFLLKSGQIDTPQPFDRVWDLSFWRRALAS